MTYIEQIKVAREKLLLTQEEIALQLGVNAVTVCRWETGKCEPTIKAKKAIRDFLIKNDMYIDDTKAGNND